MVREREKFAFERNGPVSLSGEREYDEGFDTRGGFVDRIAQKGVYSKQDDKFVVLLF